MGAPISQSPSRSTAEAWRGDMMPFQESLPPSRDRRPARKELPLGSICLAVYAAFTPGGQLAPKRPNRDAEQLSSARTIAAGLEQRTFDERCFGRLDVQRTEDEQTILLVGDRGQQAGSRHLRANGVEAQRAQHRARGENDGAVDRVLQLANVAGPVVLLEQH